MPHDKDPYTIRIYEPNGGHGGVRIVDTMNWTGVCVDFSRAKWPEAKLRHEFNKTGVYILIGNMDDDDESLPRIYVGQADLISYACMMFSLYWGKRTFKLCRWINPSPSGNDREFKNLSAYLQNSMCRLFCAARLNLPHQP